MSACPNCNMFQTAGLGFYGKCKYCGSNLNDMRKAQGNLRDDVRIASLCDIINKQKSRIAELEAEVERLKDMKGLNVKEQSLFHEALIDSVEICPDITQEGEG